MKILGMKEFYDLTVEDVRDWYSRNHNEQGLADAYAVVHMEDAYAEDCIYDYEEGTEEYESALKTADAWSALYEELEEEIVRILKEDNVDVSNPGSVDTLAIFMDRYGYDNCGGWWIERK